MKSFQTRAASVRAAPSLSKPWNERAATGTSVAPAATTDSAARTPASAARTYVVQPGDSLFRIAERVYGDSMQWKKVRDANTERIDPEGRLHVGQVLLIP